VPEQCEYDGAPLVRDSEGQEDACPVCAVDIAAHMTKCVQCRLAEEQAGEQE